MKKKNLMFTNNVLCHTFSKIHSQASFFRTFPKNKSHVQLAADLPFSL